MPKEYPALMVEDSGYAAILRGHGLAAEDLQAAELAMIGKPEEGWFTEVEEAHFDYVPPGVPRGGGLSGPRRRDRDGVSHRAMVSENDQELTQKDDTARWLLTSLPSSSCSGN